MYAEAMDNAVSIPSNRGSHSNEPKHQKFYLLKNVSLNPLESGQSFEY